jgi:hypothetical protein
MRDAVADMKAWRRATSHCRSLRHVSGVVENRNPRWSFKVDGSYFHGKATGSVLNDGLVKADVAHYNQLRREVRDEYR